MCLPVSLGSWLLETTWHESKAKDVKEKDESQEVQPAGEGKDQENDDIVGMDIEVAPVKEEEQETDEDEAMRDNLKEICQKLKRKATRMIDELRSLRRTRISQNSGWCFTCGMLNLY